ncbi:MAG: ATP-binding protein [Lachnospiraceae bacterium]|nr:ATP-binding protein [Lachnospiraceae bacterium]
MKELVVDAKIENLTEVIEFLNKELDSVGCDEKTKAKIDIAVDEIFSNVANYAYKPVDGKVAIRFDDIKEKMEVEIVFIDGGKPYNPLEKKDPNVNLTLEERDVGGLGILIVKKSMDEVLYEYKDNKNMLTIRKKI